MGPWGRRWEALRGSRDGGSHGEGPQRVLMQRHGWRAGCVWTPSNRERWSWSQGGSARRLFLYSVDAEVAFQGREDRGGEEVMEIEVVRRAEGGVMGTG